MLEFIVVIANRIRLTGRFVLPDYLLIGIIAILIAALSESACFADDRDALLAVIEHRKAVDRLTIEALIVRNQDTRDPEIRGRSSKYIFRGDFVLGHVRADEFISNAGTSTHEDRMSIAFKEGKCLIVPGLEVRGAEYSDKPKAFLRESESGTQFAMSTDPRLLGLIATPFHTLKNYTLDDLERLVRRCNLVTGDGEVSDAFVDIALANPEVDGHELNFRIEKSSGRVLHSRLRVRSKEGFQECQTVSEWGVGSQAFPKKMISTIHVNGKLKVSETFEVTEVSTGAAIDDRYFTWKGMDLPDQYVVKDMASRGANPFKTWDSETSMFETWVPKDKIPSAVPPAVSGGYREILIGVNAAIGIFALLWFFYPRNQKGDRGIEV